MTQHDKFINALTQYDKRQAKRKGYNPKALALYFEALELAEQEKDIKKGLKDYFCDPLLSILLSTI